MVVGWRDVSEMMGRCVSVDTAACEGNNPSLIEALLQQPDSTPSAVDSSVTTSLVTAPVVTTCVVGCASRFVFDIDASCGDIPCCDTPCCGKS